MYLEGTRLQRQWERIYPVERALGLPILLEEMRLSGGASRPSGARLFKVVSVRGPTSSPFRVSHALPLPYICDHVLFHYAPTPGDMSSTSVPLTSAQIHALFDILIHHQLYSEITAFKDPAAINQYGYPFKKPEGTQSTSPLLQNMLNKFALTNPALKSLSQEFWQDKVGVLVGKLAEAELSESYDKGAIGSRKALATASSSIAEYVARGMLGGYPVTKGQSDGTKKKYDTSKPEDVQRGFDDLMHGLIYDDLLEHMFKRVQETGNLEDHLDVVKAGHEYMLLK